MHFFKVDLLIEQLTSQGATFVQDPHPQLVNLISLSKDRFDQKGIEGYLPTRDYVDYEIVFIFGLEDLWSLARSSLVPGSPFLIREESMCYRAGVLIVADSLSLRTCSLEEMEGIISVSLDLWLLGSVFPLLFIPLVTRFKFSQQIQSLANL